jgi:phosphoglycolate phosphatase-like HAD superfamily hydrolase
MTLKYLILLDIDGTLIWADGIGHDSMKATLERVYGTSGPIEDYSFAGRTDREIVRDMMTYEGFEPDGIWERFEELSRVMEEEVTRRIASGDYDVRPCPGAHGLVDALAARDDVLLGLLTGNFAATARLKLQAGGFDSAAFKMGAYGGDSDRRVELAALAVERAHQLTGITFHGDQIAVVGDTPSDVACGEALGARTVGVCTGWHSRAELEAANVDVLFDDFSDTEAVLAAIFGPS